MRAHLSIAVLAAGALAVAGCGSSSNDNKSSNSGGGSSSQKTAPASSGGGNAVSLSETEFKIDPASPSVKKTGKVTFKVKNDGTITHALEVEGNGVEETKTGNIAPGKSATLTIDAKKAGSLEFYCPIDGHKAQGMKGELKVGGGSDPGSGSSSSSSSKSGGGGGGGGGGTSGY
jgi:uncharacterized cupredoxin-like copper-binding protein